jgi:ketosteroid isomerase-like protein
MGVDIERRLALVEARLALQDLVARYALAVDDHDLATLGDCFTEDGVFGSPNSPRSNGRAEIVRAFQERFARYGATVHVPHFQLLHEIGETSARGTVVGHAETATEDDTLVTAFRYEDEYAHDSGRWRFRSRHIRTIYAMPMRDLSAGGLSWIERKRWPGVAPSPAELPHRGDTGHEARGSDG